MPTMPASHNAQLLPEDKRFSSLLLPYLAPYLIYVAISSLPATLVPAQWSQLIKLLATAAALWVFRRVYRFGPYKPLHLWLALLWLPVALIAWIAPFYLLSAVGLTDVVVAADNGAGALRSYFYLRLFNSVILVAIFEELFMRVYLMGWFYQTGTQRREKGWFESLLDTFEHQHPAPLTRLPLSRFSVTATTLAFAAGHMPHEYLSAVLYFLFTTWLYHKSGSLWVCIIIHGLTNLVIGLLARFGGMGWLW